MKTKEEFYYKTKQMQKTLSELIAIAKGENDGEIYCEVSKDLEALENSFYYILQRQHDYNLRREELRLENLHNRLCEATKEEVDLFLKHADKEAIEYMYNRISETME